MKLTAPQYDRLRKDLCRCLPEVAYSGVWAQLHREYGFGTRVQQQLQLDAGTRKSVRDWIIKTHGCDPMKETLLERREQSRTQISFTGADEKWQTQRPRAPFVEARMLRGPRVDKQNSYRGIHIKDLGAQSIDYLVTVENFDTFVTLEPTFFAELIPDTKGQTLWVVYRGDNKAAPVAVKTLIETNKQLGSHYHFGDFDPAGIVIGLASGASHLILPCLSELHELSDAVRREDKFNKQHQAWPTTERITSGPLAEYSRRMLKDRLAPQQEAMMAIGMGFVLVACR